MAVTLSPVGGVAGQFFDNNGNPLVGGKLYTYAAGTTTPQATFTSAAGITFNSNPIILNSGGRVPAEIWLTDGLQYKFVLYTSTDQLIGSWDNIVGINSNFVNFTTYDEVQIATAGQTVFTLTTMSYQPGTNNLVVYVDGVNQVEGGSYSYVETNSTTVTFTAGLHLGAIVKFVSAEILSTGVVDASNVVYTPAGSGVVTTNVQAKLRETVSVKDFGAVGDGIVDDTAAIQAAVNAVATLGGGVLYFPVGTYKCSSAINIGDNTTLLGYGATLDYSAATRATRVRIEGSIGSGVLLTANALEQGLTIDVASAAGFADGDLILISSDALVPSSSETIGEFARIVKIVGNTLYLYSALDDGYLTADNAKVQKISPKKNVNIMGLTILGAGPVGSDTSSTEIGISALYCEHLLIQDCAITACDYQAIAIDQCYIVNVKNNHIRQIYRGDDTWQNVIQYGIAMKNAASVVNVRNNMIEGGRHGIVWTENNLPGVGRDYVIDGNTIYGTYLAAIATHESNENFTIVNNHIKGCTRGMDIRVRRGVIANNTIRDLVLTYSNNYTGDGIFLSLLCSDLLIQGNTIYNARYGVRMYNLGLPASSRPYNVRIVDNVISDISQIGIYLEQTQNAGNFRNWVVSNNTIRECASDFVRLNGVFYSPIISNNNIKTFVGSSGYGIRLLGTTRAQITGNYFENVIPMLMDYDTQTVPVAPDYTVIANNTWDNNSTIVSVSAGTNLIRKNNIKVGDTNLVIVSGEVDVLAGVQYFTIDTEGSAASDDLDTINGGITGDIMTFKATSTARTVVFKDGTGNLSLDGDFSLDSNTDTITLVNTGSGWAEVCRSNNAA